MVRYKKGDLVHIPQAVVLVDHDLSLPNDPQLTIPLRIEELDSPKLGVITDVSSKGGYVRVFCDGDVWSVEPSKIYFLSERANSD